MSRKFKFRTWNKPFKQFHYTDELSATGFSVSTDLYGMKVYSWIRANNIKNLSEYFGCDDKESWVIQEFIGKVDRDNKEIYEGDIVEYIEKMDDHGDAQKLTGLVKYDDYFCAFGISATEDGDCMNYFSDFTINHFKVVGNIFENPELLIK